MATFRQLCPSLPDSYGFMIGIPIIIYILVSYIHSWYRLRYIPGPRLAGWTYLYIVLQYLPRKQGALYRVVNDRYGHLVRIGPNELLTDDPDIIRRMSAARSNYRRSNWYKSMRMNPYQDSLFSMTDTAAHDKLKAQMSFGYGGKENPTIEEGIDEQLANLHALIQRKYISTDTDFRPIDLATVIQYFTLDALTRIAYGKEFGYLETDSDVHAYIETSEAYVPIIVLFAEIPFLGRVFFSPLALKLLGPKHTDKVGIGKMIG